MRKVHSAPFCTGAGQRRGILSGLLLKWKREVCGRAGNRSHIAVLHHVHGPTPPPAYLLWWVMFCTAAKATLGASGRSRSCGSGQICDPPGRAARLTLSTGDDRGAGSRVCVPQQNPGTAGCSRSSMTSPPLLFSDIVLLLRLAENSLKYSSPIHTASPLPARVTT